MGFFYIIHIIICLLLVVIILFQDGKTGGLVSVSDNSNAQFGSRGASNFLTKLTSGVAIVFMASSLFLAYQSAPSSKSIASDFQPAQSGEPAPTVESTGPVTITDEEGNEKAISFDEANPNIEVVTDPSQLPPELRGNAAEKKDSAAASEQSNEEGGN